MAGCGNRTRAMGFCLCIWVVITVGISAGAGLPRFEHHPTKGDGSVSFLVVGDWGRKGHYNQSRVASQMGRIGDQLDIDFVVSTGDNFYDDGLKGEDDPAFLESFSNIYTPSSLSKPWFAVLGNHDYRGDVLAQLSPALRRIDRRWVCFRSFVVDADVAELFFVDTNPFVRKYFTQPKDHVYDWRGVLPVTNYIAQLLEDLDSALKASKATWKIIVAHHPIRSAGHHGDTLELHHQLLSILEANNIDLYINGHDHCLEHISDQASGIQYLTSGAGSKAWRGGFDTSAPGLRFYHDGQGFMSVEATQSHVQIIFYDVFGNVVHEWLVSKNQLHPIL